MEAVVEPHGFTIARARARVLIADEHADSVVTLTVLLADVVSETDGAYEIRPAIHVPADIQPDVVMLDKAVPHLNGYAIDSRLRSQSWGRNVLLIAVTAWSIFEPSQQAVDAGVDQYATKPMDLEALSSLLGALAE